LFAIVLLFAVAGCAVAWLLVSIAWLLISVAWCRVARSRIARSRISVAWCRVARSRISVAWWLVIVLGQSKSDASKENNN